MVGQSEVIGWRMNSPCWAAYRVPYHQLPDPVWCCVSPVLADGAWFPACGMVAVKDMVARKTGKTCFVAFLRIAACSTGSGRPALVAEMALDCTADCCLILVVDTGKGCPSTMTVARAVLREREQCSTTDGSMLVVVGTPCFPRECRWVRSQQSHLSMIGSPSVRKSTGTNWTKR